MMTTSQTPVTENAPAPGASSEFHYPPIERPHHPSFPLEAMQALLKGERAEIADRMLAQITRPDFRYYDGRDVREYREKVLYWCRELAKAGFPKLGMPKSVGGDEDPFGQIAAFEMLGYHDVSLLIKYGVQFGLYGGSIYHLGTERHHQKYLRDCYTLKTPGGFAMTELGHGSNVRDITTTATYDVATDEFVLHSPLPSSGKTYIGNAAQHAQNVTTFAQLVIGEKRHGVHAFVTPIRDTEGNVLAGVTIEDNGLKEGLNGVDNGKIWFDHVRIPRENLLDRFAQVSPEGVYSSEIQNESARFFTMLATLVGGRISVAAAGLSAAKSALTIAIRYGARRRQFGASPGAPETLLLDYPVHQRRLMPLLATVYASHFTTGELAFRLVNRTPKSSRFVETLAAAFKAFTTWNCTHTLQVCREACGGEGYMSVNRLGDLRADTDIFTTFEGDNTVLMQLAAKNLLSDLNDQLKNMSATEIGKIGFKQITQKLFGSYLRYSRPNSTNLLSPNFYINALNKRQEILLYQTAMAYRKATKLRGSYHAFLDIQLQLMSLSSAFIEHFIAQIFQLTVERTEATLQPTLRKLSALFALSCIEKNAAWYLENKYLSHATTRAITKQMDQLCSEVRHDAVELVDAFGIPNSCLAAPIALG